MKRTLVLAALFALLGTAALWFLARRDQAATSITDPDKDFALPNADEVVYKVFMADRNGKTLTLERKDNGEWRVNNHFKARPEAIMVLMQVIKHMAVKYVPTQASVKNIVADLATLGIKVELYDRDGKKIKAFYVGGMTNDERGTYMIMENSDNPYVMHIPMVEGGLRDRFFLGEEDWKDKIVFAEEAENISSVKVEYPDQRAKSFLLERKGRDYELSPLGPGVPKSPYPLKPGRVEEYLSGYKKLGAEAFRNTLEARDSIIRTVPFCIITLKNNKNEEKSLHLYPIPAIAPDGEMLKDQFQQPVIERYFADCSNGQFYLVQHYVFGKVLWGYDSFFDLNKQ